MLRHYEKVRDVVLPTLGPERRATYSPFLPRLPAHRTRAPGPDRGMERATQGPLFTRTTAGVSRVPVTGGHCKLQWKADWAMRWFAMSVDYEMSGKDLIPSVELSTKIVRLLGGTPPETFIFELFLDEQGQKISKSKGNGLSVDEWLPTARRKASRSSCSASRTRPRSSISTSSRRRSTNTSLSPSNIYAHRTIRRASSRIRSGSFTRGNPPAETYPVSFALLLNLVSASGAQDREVLWGFIRAYAPDADPETHPGLDRLVTYALKYYEDFVHPQKRYREPTVEGARGAVRACRYAREHGRRTQRRDRAERGLRDRQDARLRAAARLVQGDLRSRARPGAGTALRLVRGALRLRRNRGADPHRVVRRIYVAMRALKPMPLSLMPESHRLDPLRRDRCRSRAAENHAAGDVRERRLSRRRQSGRCRRQCCQSRARRTRHARRCHLARHAVPGVPSERRSACAPRDRRRSQQHGRPYPSCRLRSAIRRASSARSARASARFPEQAQEEIETALRLAPNSHWALSAAGGFNIEVVRSGGRLLGNLLYGATFENGVSYFHRAIAADPENPLIKLQYALALTGYAFDARRPRSPPCSMPACARNRGTSTRRR